MDRKQVNGADQAEGRMEQRTNEGRTTKKEMDRKQDPRVKPLKSQGRR